MLMYHDYPSLSSKYLLSCQSTQWETIRESRRASSKQGKGLGTLTPAQSKDNVLSPTSSRQLLQIQGQAIKLGFGLQKKLDFNADNTFTWNTMIRVYSQGDTPLYALLLFDEMLKNSSVPPDRFTFPFALKACTRLQASEEGQQLHAFVLKSGFVSQPVVLNALIHMYAQTGLLQSARLSFETNPRRDVVSWNSLIGGYLKHGNLGEATRLFFVMPYPKTAVSWNIVISAYAASASPQLAQSLLHQLPSEIFDDSASSSTILRTCLISLYVQSGDVEAARSVFDNTRDVDVVCWSAMISGYVRRGHHSEALRLFKKMRLDKTAKPDKVTLVSVISACSYLGALNQGKWVHMFITKNFPLSVSSGGELACALIDMYSKCGSIETAIKLFAEMPTKDLLAWNSIICGLGINGQGKVAVSYLSDMLKNRIMPDGITFVGILGACSHAGLLDEGWQCFQLMRTYGIHPDVKHYGCMIDLLGRAGLMEEAEALVHSMPMQPSVEIWGALLGACRKHGNVEIAERAAKSLIELDPDHRACLVLLYNTYAAAGRWEDARGVRERIKSEGIKRVPGCSSIESKGSVYEFVVGDVSHPRAGEIYAMVGEVRQRLRMVNHVADTSEVLFDIGEEEKEGALGYHSEKLALALGLIDAGPEESIRIVKNLRVCGDCHSTMKVASQLYNREIILRDRNRFHHFRGGSCSCMDYW